MNLSAYPKVKAHLSKLYGDGVEQALANKLTVSPRVLEMMEADSDVCDRLTPSLCAGIESLKLEPTPPPPDAPEKVTTSKRKSSKKEDS